MCGLLASADVARERENDDLSEVAKDSKEEAFHQRRGSAQAHTVGP